ncbi:MAG: sensor histidine kinase [Anaerolineales bacterium]|jgi:signal transduction histidine kinase
MAEGTGRILVVDDNRMNRIKLSRSLENQGYVVGLAEGGQQALDMLNQDVFDVVLLDIIMPEMDGFQVLEKIKCDPNLRDIPVIVISALDETESAVRCIEMGAEDYLPKSFDPVLLRARLGASLQKKRLRDLEKAYLEQEMTLRQNEKLATIGRLSAGMAHELNNPSAAASRGAKNIALILPELLQAYVQLIEKNLKDEQLNRLLELDSMAAEKVRNPINIDPMTRSDLEAELEEWLGSRSVDNSWDVAPKLVKLGLDESELEGKFSVYDRSQFPAVIQWLNCTCEIYRISTDISRTTGRISDIVNALKVYTFLDQAPVQSVDINTGLDSTLTILKSKLNGIAVKRDYEKSLPKIEAYGSELNQVWTNLIENAIEALNESGEIRLITRLEGDWVLVAVEDTGPGIPGDIQSKIFDPFYTTKPVGQGTGLGLNISHNIITQKHRGRIEVESQPGKTRFEVWLPLSREMNIPGI